MKKYLSLFLAFVMVISIFTIPTFAVEKDIAEVGGWSTSYSLSGNAANDIVSVALAQKGKYGADLGYSSNWCARFVAKCASIIGQSKAIPDYGAVSTLYEKVKSAGGYDVSSPQKGDLVFYYCTSSSSWCHVGIMTDSINSIHGNLSNQAMSIKYNQFSDSIGKCWTATFVRPNYSSNTHTTHSYDTYVYYWDAHPHYKCYKCSCGEIKENRNELTYVESCKDCQAHTCDQKIYYSYWAAHPHYYLYKCSLCGKASEDFSQKKYIDSCKDCQEHTCDQEVYYSYWDAHPHYYLYKCSLCGKESTDYSQTKTVSGCEYCYPGKPTIIVDCDTFDSSVSFYWGATTNTDNYTLHLHDVDNNYKYPLITNITDLHYKLSLPAGNYTVQLASINEELRGTNRWYTMSDIVEFSVINKPLIMIGDTDGDGKVTIKDATTIQKHVAGITAISDEKFACADTDKDGKISVKDATRIQKFLAGIISSL